MIGLNLPKIADEIEKIVLAATWEFGTDNGSDLEESRFLNTYSTVLDLKAKGIGARIEDIRKIWKMQSDHFYSQNPEFRAEILRKARLMIEHVLEGW